MLVQGVAVCLLFQETTRSSPLRLCIPIVPPTVYHHSSALHPHQHLALPFSLSRSDRCEVISYSVSLMTYDEHVFHVPIGHLDTVFREVPAISLILKKKK